MTDEPKRREFLRGGILGIAGAGIAATALTAGSVQQVIAQSQPGSLLQTVLNRGKILIGTGSTNAPWHFEDESGKLVGMDIAMGQILAQGLFGDPSKVEFVLEDPAQRIPNVLTGKVDAAIQFMTISSQRAQLVNFSRPYYVEGVALLSRPDAQIKTGKQMLENGSATKISILQNVGAEEDVHKVLPDATVLQLDTQANVIQALESKRVDAAAVDLSTVGWLTARHPDRYFDAGLHWNSQLYGAALRKNDLDWLVFVDTCFTVAMYGNENEIYDPAFKKYFGVSVPQRKTGFPPI